MDEPCRDGGVPAGGLPGVEAAVRALASVLSSGAVDGMALPKFFDLLDATARSHGVGRDALHRAFAAAHGGEFRVVLAGTGA